MKVIFDGQKAFDEYISLIQGAKKSIWIATYMIHFDEKGKRIMEELRKKHDEGVDVKVLYDWLGSFRAVPRLSKIPFTKAFIPKWSRLNTRNHAKIMLIDGKTGVISGRNFSNLYFGDWKDATIVFKGKKIIDELKDFIRRLEKQEPRKKGYEGKTRHTDPLNRSTTIYNFILESIAKAKKRIILLTPYFVIDEALRNLLLAAADRGVEITIATPENPDHKLFITINRVNFEKIYHRNIEFLHTKHMFHTKAMIFDKTAIIGSANFDSRSFRHNMELSIILPWHRTKKVENHIHEVITSSHSYNWVQKAYDRIILLFLEGFMDYF